MSKLHEHGKTSKKEQAGKSVVNMHQQRNERKYAHVSRRKALLALASYKQEGQNVYSIGQVKGTPLMVISLIVQL